MAQVRCGPGASRRLRGMDRGVDPGLALAGAECPVDRRALVARRAVPRPRPGARRAPGAAGRRRPGHGRRGALGVGSAPAPGRVRRSGPPHPGPLLALHDLRRRAGDGRSAPRLRHGLRTRRALVVALGRSAGHQPRAGDQPDAQRLGRGDPLLHAPAAPALPEAAAGLSAGRRPVRRAGAGAAVPPGGLRLRPPGHLQLRPGVHGRGGAVHDRGPAAGRSRSPARGAALPVLPPSDGAAGRGTPPARHLRQPRRGAGPARPGRLPVADGVEPAPVGARRRAVARRWRAATGPLHGLAAGSRGLQPGRPVREQLGRRGGAAHRALPRGDAVLPGSRC